MKICIIHINNSKPALPTLEDSPERFMRCITPYTDFKVEWDVVRILGDELPDVHDYDGYLITGGGLPHVTDIAPETTKLMEFIRKVHDAKIPLVGICWGHQVTSMALGGKIEISSKGYGMGIKDSKVVKKLDWMQYAPETVSLYSMHRCQVVEPPKNADVYLTSDFCEYGGFVIDNHVFTMQQHPDYNLGVSRGMIETREDRLPAEDWNLALESLSKPQHTELACQWVGNFFLQHAK